MDPYKTTKTLLTSSTNVVNNWLTKSIDLIFILYCVSLVIGATEIYNSYRLFGKEGDGVEAYATFTPIFLVLISLSFLLTYFVHKWFSVVLIICVWAWIIFLTINYAGRWRVIWDETFFIGCLAIWISINKHYNFFQRALINSNLFKT